MEPSSPFFENLPGFLTLKECSTSLTKPLFPQGRENVTALWCSEPLRSKVGGPSKVFAMVMRAGTARRMLNLADDDVKRFVWLGNV